MTGNSTETPLRTRCLADASGAAERLLNIGQALMGRVRVVVLVLTVIAMLGSCAEAGGGAGFAGLLAGLGSAASA
jgi:hypothetical protein